MGQSTLVVFTPSVLCLYCSLVYLNTLVIHQGVVKITKMHLEFVLRDIIMYWYNIKQDLKKEIEQDMLCLSVQLSQDQLV